MGITDEDTLLAVAREAETHRAGNLGHYCLQIRYILYLLVATGANFS